MKYDCIVIGGGPAGLFAAITAAKNGHKILLLEKNNSLGKKLLITGKGRCNVTNNTNVQEVLKNIPCNGRFLYSAINTYPPEKIIEFFEENGCALKTERGNRVFPVSDRAASVLECLKKQLDIYGVTIIHEAVREILAENGEILGVKTPIQTLFSRCVILATGGISYPTTGSTGDGYKLANELGHTIIPPVGALVPLEAEGQDCAAMQGLSLRNVGVKLIDAHGKNVFSDFGELLFTHFGVSGPTILTASTHINHSGYTLLIDLKPALDKNKLDERVLRDLNQYKNRTMENALIDLLPRSMIPVVLNKLNILPFLQANSLKKEQRKALVNLLKGFPVQITGKRPVAEAIITSGGIKVSQINPKTMESKLIKNLYFAGEIIDCNAYTGGFNLQIAWSTAYVAGMSVKNSD